MKFVLDDEELSKLMERTAGKGGDFFDAEMAIAIFETDQKTIERIVPEPLTPSAIPFATVFIAKYPKTSFGSVYNEAALSIGVEYEEEAGSYCLTMPVTEDMACILGREIFGFPKKIADEISMITTEKGVKGSYIRKNVELMNLSMSFDREVEIDEFSEIMSLLTSQKLEDKEWEVVSYNFKFFLNPELTGFDYKPRLVKQVTTFRPTSKIKLSSNFDLRLESSDCDHLADVTVKKPIIGFYGIFNNTMHPGEVVAEVEDLEFMRYAFSKIDYL
ncbi:MAG: acetoacetate decarboxylase family protein [Candidatus Lokiarchaeia archaeon]